MVVAVRTMRAVKMAVHKIVGMVAVRNRFVAAARKVLVGGIMATARVRRGTVRGI